MDWSKGALPMGMLFFGFMVFGFVRRKAGHVVARGQYPKLAEKLGLEYKPSRYDTGVGTLAGTLEGFRVSVDPDDQRRMVVRFAGEPQIEAWNHAHNKRPGPGMTSFRPMDKRALGFLKTASGSPEAIAAIDNSKDFGEWIARLKGIRALKSFSITPSGVTATFDFGNPPRIPADVVAELLPMLVKMASLFETPSSHSASE